MLPSGLALSDACTPKPSSISASTRSSQSSGDRSRRDHKRVYRKTAQIRAHPHRHRETRGVTSVCGLTVYSAAKRNKRRREHDRREGETPTVYLCFSFDYRFSIHRASTIEYRYRRRGAPPPSDILACSFFASLHLEPVGGERSLVEVVRVEHVVLRLIRHLDVEPLPRRTPPKHHVHKSHHRARRRCGVGRERMVVDRICHKGLSTGLYA